jgi:hypothetical protein
MFADPGKPHRGWDCFIFPRYLYPSFNLLDVCLGVPRVGLALLANMVAYSESFKEFQDEHLTFHIGDSRIRLKKEYLDFNVHNSTEVKRVLSNLEEERGPFPRESIPGSYLLRRRTFGPLYDAWSHNIYLPTNISRFVNRISGRR